MEAEDIRKKKMDELNQRYSEQQEQQEKAMQLEMQLDSIMRHILTPEAKTRLSNVKLVNRELYLLAAQNLVYLKKAGQLPERLGDAELKAMLEKIRDAGKRDVTIKRK